MTQKVDLVYGLGERVKIACPKEPIEAVVTAATVRLGDGRPRYEVVWWNGRTRCENWVEEAEIIPM